MGGDATAASRTVSPQGARVGRDRERDCGHESAVLAMNSSSNRVYDIYVTKLMTFDDTFVYDYPHDGPFPKIWK